MTGVSQTSTSITTNVNDFAKKTATQGRALPAVRLKRVVKASDASVTFLKLMFFGEPGTGKTYFIMSLLLLGYKVLVVSTDLAGEGLNAVRIPLRKMNRTELLDNLYLIELSNNDEMQAFLDRPETFFPEIYESGINVLYWDGFGTWQMIQVSETVGEHAEQLSARSSNNKEVPDAISSGNFTDQQGYNMVRNITSRGVNDFCILHNTKTGEKWHKVISCQEGYKSVPQGKASVIVESKIPLLSGAAAKIIPGAFDLIIRTDKKFTSSGPEFVYQINAENLAAKSRGFDLPGEMPADGIKLWTEATKQLGIPLPEGTTR